MSDDAKKKPTRYMSPKGTAIYPWLNKADTKFKPEGEYRLKLRVTAEAAAPMLKVLEPMHAQAVKDAEVALKKDPKRKGKKLKVNDLFNTVFDDDGNETGEIEFNFKRTASGISKKDQKPWAIVPDLFDAQGNKLDPDVKVYGGSLVKVAYTATSYDKPIGCGISLRLEAVQVIKLVSGSRGASSYGFNNESDDEDADADQSSDNATDSDDPGTGEPAGGDDF